MIFEPFVFLLGSLGLGLKEQVDNAFCSENGRGNNHKKMCLFGFFPLQLDIWWRNQTSEKKQSFSSDGFENKQKTVSVICQVASEKYYTVTIADVEKKSRKQKRASSFCEWFCTEKFWAGKITWTGNFPEGIDERDLQWIHVQRSRKTKTIYIKFLLKEENKERQGLTTVDVSYKDLFKDFQ